MKRIILFSIIGFLSFAAHAQSMKMVVDSNNEVVGRYISQNGDQYVVAVQDDYTVPVNGHKVVTFSAANGQGIVYINMDRTGTINVRKGPSTSTDIVAKIANIPGDMPTIYPCLGLEDGWYKISIDGTIGYVRQDLLTWDGMDTF